MTIANNFTIEMDISSQDGDMGEIINRKIHELYGDYIFKNHLAFRVKIEVIKQEVPIMLPTMNEAGRTLDSAMEAYEKTFGKASGIPDTYLNPNDYKK